MIDYSVLAFPKGTPRSVVKLQKDRLAKAVERKVRAKVDKRDKRRCFWPGCRAKAFHKHHKIYRSHGGKWATDNILSGCGQHHGWVHNGLIRVIGNPDKPPLKIELTLLGALAKIRIPTRTA